MRNLFTYLCTAVLLSFISTSQAQIKKDGTEDLLNERTQLEYCATYVPCAIAVGIMDSAAAGLSFIDKVKAYIRTFGNTPIRSEREFRAYLATLSAAERKQYVDKCIISRGTFMRDYCEESYLTESELKRLEKSRLTQRPDMTKDSAMRARKMLADKDAELISVLGPTCKMTDSGPSFGCSYLLDEITRFESRIALFNSDLTTLQFVAPFESVAIKKILTLYDRDNDHGTIKWIPKEPTKVAKTELPTPDPRFNTIKVTPTNIPPGTEDEAWKSLPTRAGDAALDKQFEGVLNASKSISSSDPYAGTSSRLSPEQIELDRQRYQESSAQSMALLNGLLNAAVAYKSGGKTKALEAFIQSQIEPADTAKSDLMEGSDAESPVVVSGAGVSSSGDCDSLIAKQERAFDVVNRRNAGSLTANYQRTMWMASERIKLIKSSCPNAPKYQREMKEMQTVFSQAKTACGQISSGGGCVAKSH